VEKKFIKVQDNRTIEVALQMHNALKIIAGITNNIQVYILKAIVGIHQ
jgi:hypothetical protein